MLPTVTNYSSIKNQDVIQRKKSSKVQCQKQEYDEDHAQLGKTTSRMDRAADGGSSEGNGGSFMMEEDCP